MSQNEAYYDTLALIEKGQWCFGSMDEENEERAIKAAKALALFARLCRISVCMPVNCMLLIF